MSISSTADLAEPITVRVTDSTKSTTVLTDGFGQFNDQCQAAVAQCKALGLTSEDVEAIVKTHSNCFKHEEAFLVYDKQAEALRIMVEFEIAIEHIPGAHPKNMKVSDLNAWRTFLASLAPIFHYIGANLNMLAEDTTAIETLFDFGGYNNGSIFVMLPLERTERYTDTYLLMF